MEIIVNQYHIGRLLAHICSILAHCNANVCLLEGHTIVDSVSGHAHNVARTLQGLDNLQLVSWRDAIEDAHIVRHLVQLMLVQLIDLLARQCLMVYGIDAN